MKRLLLLMPLFMSLAFIAGAQSIPNPDFENWSATPISFDQSDSGWYNSNPNCIALLDTVNVWKMAGASGQAVKLQTTARTVATGVIDTVAAYMANTSFMPLSGKGGAAYAQTNQPPSHLEVRYMCGVASFDTAFILVIFKKNGTPTSLTEIRLWGSMGTWKDSSFAINPPVLYDSVIIAAVSTNIITNIYKNPASWLAIDNMVFITSSTPQAIAGGSFDAYVTPSPSLIKPTGWAENGNGFAYDGDSQNTTAQHNAYALELVTEATGGSGGGTGPAAMSVSSGYFTSRNGSGGGLAYTYTGADTLSGYYKYTAVGTDTGFVTVTLQQTGGIDVPGFPKTVALPSASSYTQFKVGWGTSAQPPATMRIDFTSSCSGTPGAGSTLVVDNLSLKSQSTSSVNNVNFVSDNLIVFPNPANDVLNIMFNTMPSSNVTVRIYDLAGKTLLQKEFSSNSTLHVPVAQLPTGMYFYEVTADGTTSRNKFIKE